MTTGNVFFPSDQGPAGASPSHEAKQQLGPAGAPAATPKRKKEFASVIEQAMRRRAARTASAEREGALAARPVRGKAVGLAKSSGPVAEKEGEPACCASQRRAPERGGVVLDPPQHPGGTTSTSPHNRDSAHAVEGALVDEALGEELSLNVQSSTLNVERSIPTAAAALGSESNIVPFPVPSVIIPFPLSEAKAMSGSAHAVEGALVDEALGEELSLNVQSSTLNVERSIPTADGSGTKPGASVSSDSTDGLDISGLGLTLIDDLEGPENVHPVNFTKPAERGTGNAEVIPFILRSAEESPAAQSQLPGQSAAAEVSAPMADSTVPVVETRPQPAEIRLLTSAATKATVGTGLPGPERRPALAHKSGVEATGISAARQKGRMESLSNLESGSAHSKSAGHGPGAVTEAPAGASSPVLEDGDVLDFSARNLSATEWQTGRPVSSSDRPATESINPQPADTTGRVERISRLVLGEAALIKQHSSDSMAVVLRPDAETELLVHLTQRNGQIEATVRCERGDWQQLGALWSQLQESLAQHKVRLAPLQEPPSNPSNFNPPAGSESNGQGQGSHRQSSPEKQSMDEWPAPASSNTGPAHVRGRGGSRHRRLTTSRPGWETWA